MNKYIVFLRGINVGGKNKILMKDLKELLVKFGFSDVITYIQSGNVVLTSDLTKQKVSQLVKEAVYRAYGFDVPVISETRSVLLKQVENSPYLEKEDLKKVYFTLLSETPTKENWEVLVNANFGAGEIALFEHMVYLYCPDGYGKTKITNNYIEKKLKVTATTRNLNTIKKMLALSE